jgi:hypothetical protein
MIKNDILRKDLLKFEWLRYCTEGKSEVNMKDNSLKIEHCHHVECQAQVRLQGTRPVRDGQKLASKPYSWGLESGEMVKGEQGIV